MNEQSIDALRRLCTSSAVRKSKVARIRDLLPEIELAQNSGVRLADIAATLSENGFDGMNMKCLQNLLYQARRKKVVRTTKSAVIAQTIAPIGKSPKSGIDADTIIQEARNAMQSKTPASNLTLNLLRTATQKSTTTERITK